MKSLRIDWCNSVSTLSNEENRLRYFESKQLAAFDSMPHATFRKKFRSFLDLPEYCDCSGSDENLPFGSLSPSSTCTDLEDSRDAKSPVGDTSTFRRAIKRTLSWKRRKSQSIDTLHPDVKLTPEEESCTIFIIGYSGVGKTGMFDALIILLAILFGLCH